jgi:carbonic anhydrase
VSLPLSLGIAVASGAPVMAGLIAGVVGGIVGGLAGGSPLQVSGPAAGLLAITAEMITNFGWPLTCAITVVGGGLQILLGLSRIARTALAISPAVVHGMLAGIGVTISAGQLHVLLGGASHASALDSLLLLPDEVTAIQPAAVAIGLLAIAVMLGWAWIPMIGKIVPAPLAAVVLCTIISLPWQMPRVTLPDDPLSAVSLPSLGAADWQRLSDSAGAMLLAAVTMALVASVESLLSAVAVDRLHDGPRSNLDRELIGQGTSNMVSGALSGLPISAVIVRSSTNVAAGARTRQSAMMNGLWVAAFAVALGPVLNRIPLSALAGLLVVIGARLVNPGHIRTVTRHHELVSYLLTLGAVIVMSLLEGVMLGYASALVIILRRAVKAPTHLEPPRGPDEPWRVVVEGTLSFLALPRLSRQLAAIPAGAPVRLELLVDYLDHAAYELLEDWSQGHRRTGGVVTVDEIGPPLMSQIEAGDPPTSRAGGRARAPRWLASWSDWQFQHTVAAGDLLTGVEEFHRRTAPMLRERLGELSAGQSPSTLFVTCSDSRIVPNVITSSGPGDLFTIRNVGAFVPGPEDACDSTYAAIEVAVTSLRVRTIVVCGHTGCSAMKTLLAGTDPYGRTGQDGTATDLDGTANGRELTPALRSWLRHGRGALTRFRWSVPEPGLPEVDQLARANVIEQLANLRALDLVREAERQGRVQLVGMMFDIAAASALILDESTGRFASPGGDRVRLPSRRESRQARTGEGSTAIDLGRLATAAKRLFTGPIPQTVEVPQPTLPDVGPGTTFVDLWGWDLDVIDDG